MSLVGTLRRLDAAHTADDVPLWAGVLGPLLAFGLVLRGGIHVWVALLATDALGMDIDPHVDKQDVKLASPVLALRGHRLDIAARFISAGVGIGLWGMVEAAGHWIAVAWLALQLGVLVCDPLALALWRLKTAA